MNICPNCGSSNPDDGRWCASCGSALTPAEAAPKVSRLSGNLARSGSGSVAVAEPVAPIAPPTPPVMPARFCMHCGAPVAEGDHFCLNCGKDPDMETPVSTPVAPVSTPPVSRPAPARKPVPKNDRRISVWQELLLLLGESAAILVGETRNLIISLLFPLGAAAVTVWIAGENMYVNFESSKSACFILVCAAIWGGLFNSIQVIVKERENVKRDYVSGALRIECYTASRALVQMVLCAIQSAVLCLSFIGVELFYGNDLPSYGLIFDSPMVEYYITVFLVMFAADTMGLMISSFVKSEQLASQLSPYILIVQLLFSGVLFAMEGAASGVSALMLSRWGMEALGSISDLNEMPLRIAKEYEDVFVIENKGDDAFIATAEHLGEVWLILVLFVLVPLVIGDFCLHGVKKDSRD